MTTTVEPKILFELEDGSTAAIEQIQIRNAGWIKETEAASYCEGCCEAQHCDDGNCYCASPEPIVEALKQWHDLGHTGAFQNCYAEPCNTVRRLA
jgi:hypothetical protein